MKAAKLSAFLKFGKAMTSKICIISAKNHGWPRNWGAWSKTGGLCSSPGLGLKPPLHQVQMNSKVFEKQVSNQ